MSEIQEESTTGIGLADVPNTQEDQEEMLSSLCLDDLPDEEQEAEPDPKLYLVVAPTVGFARVEQMATLEDLRAELIALEGKDVHVFVFAGERYNVTKGPYRHLIPASGEPITLFDLPEADALEVDDKGYLGPPPSALKIPPPLPEELEEDVPDEIPDGWEGEPPDEDEDLAP